MRVKSSALQGWPWRFLATGIALALLIVAAARGARVSVAASSPTVFAVIGDFGMDNADELAIQGLVNGWSPSFIATAGDNFYSTAITAGDTGNAYHETVGKYFCPYLKDIAGVDTCPAGTSATNRFFPVLGNHDYADALPAPGTYAGYFTLPGTGVVTSGSSGNERYYDYVQGPVHIFVLNSNTQEPDGTSGTSIQAQWLQRQLAASTSAWNIVMFHHSPYSSDNVHGSTAYMQWPFAQWGADAVVTAHAHDYERLSVDGIVYLVDGLGGAQTYGFGTPVAGSQFRYTGQHGALRVTATDTSLAFELITVDGAVQDSYTLTQGTPPTATPTATASPTPAGALTVSFQNGVAPTASYAGGTDTYLSQANPAISYGAANACLVDGDDPPGTGQDLSCLLRWDVSAIPPGSTVTGASVTLYVTNNSVSLYPVYSVLQPWREAEATWQVYAAGLPWAVAGALGSTDRGATSVGALDATATGVRTFSLNAAGLAAVQSWVNNPSSNQGLIVADSNITDGVDFGSDQWVTASQRPRLTVQYVVGVLQPSATPTNTSVPPTNTPTNTPTPTALPPTSTATRTATSVPATSTPTLASLPPTSTPTRTGTPTATAAPAASTPTATPVPALHVGDLADASTRYTRSWSPGVSVLVHNASHIPLSGATVSGSWSGGISGTGSCVSATNGTCKVAYSRISSSINTVQFTVTNVVAAGTVYNPTANHDPDTDSNGTTIVLTR